MSQFQANPLESACLLLGVQMSWGSLLCCIFVELRRLRSTCHQWKVPFRLQQLPGWNDDVCDTERLQSSSYQKLLRHAEGLLNRKQIIEELLMLLCTSYAKLHQWSSQLYSFGAHYSLVALSSEQEKQHTNCGPRQKRAALKSSFIAHSKSAEAVT